MVDQVHLADAAGGGVMARACLEDAIRPKGRFRVVCYAEDGSIRWEEDVPNLVTDAGRTDVLEKFFRRSATRLHGMSV
jgi:hypothetical protein